MMAAPDKSATQHLDVPWRKTFRRLLAAAGASGGQLRRSLFGLSAAAATQGLALACLVPLFSAVIADRDPKTAIAWLVAMSALSLAAIAIRWRAQGFDYSGQMSKATHDLRLRLGEQLRRMPLEKLQDRRSGEINATLLGNVDENFSYTLIVSDLIFTALVTPLVASLAVLFYDWKLGLLLLAIFPAIIPLYRWRRPVHARGRRALDDMHQRMNADIVEYVQGLPAVRAARRSGERAATLKHTFDELETLQTVEHRASANPNVIIASIVEIGLLVVVAAGVMLVIIGQTEIAVLAAVAVMVSRFAEPLATFVTYTVVIEMIEAALDRIDLLLAEKPLPRKLPERQPDGAEIRFEEVTFQYMKSNRPALENFSAILPPRSLTALVGPSGSGKSTIARLLLRHADPQHGSVRIGGADVREIRQEKLNALTSVVFQDVYLFDDTVLNNIRMARPDASDAEVESAARSACCTEFIEKLPEGWRTRIGDVGGKLSGGERQRLSIARALLKDAPIVILDEPTAVLDSQSERAVQTAIDALVRDKTVLVIAHRLSTVAGADRILVLDEGRVIESGRHAELLAANGRYRAMWDIQSQTRRWRRAEDALATK